MDIEQREIPGFPGYWVGSDGSLWSSRYGKRGASEKRRLTIFRRAEGNRYCTVNLRAERNGKSRPLYVHRLVLLAFVGPAPESAEADHIDADTSNNAVSNLRWVTKAENLARRTIARGELRPEAKVTEDDVRAIRASVASGTTRKVVGARYGLSRQSIDRIVNGQGWRHVG